MKKTRKALLAVLACSVALAGAAGLAACSGGGDDGHQHAWSNWTVSTQPTDEATGKATRTCSGEGECDAKAADKEATLPVLTSTDYTKGSDTATCQAAGSITYTYNNGGVTVSFDVATPINADNHTATCGHQTPTVHVHQWSKWTVEDENKPIARAPGKATRTCTGAGECDAEATDKEYELPSLNQTDYTMNVVSVATCAETGLVVYTYDAYGVNVDVNVETAINPTAHNYPEQLTVDKAATCRTKGLASKHCTNCGAKTEITEIDFDSESHVAADTYVEKAATCAADGEKYKPCTLCGAKTELTTLAKLEHDFETAFTIDKKATCTATGTKSRHCKNCSTGKTDVTAIEKATHDLTHHAAVPAEGCVSGNIEYWSCSICNNNYGNEACTNKLAVNGEIDWATVRHAGDWIGYEVPAVAPTCTTDGFKSYYFCDTCDGKFTDMNYYAYDTGVNRLPVSDDELRLPAGHGWKQNGISYEKKNITTTSAKEATCTADGYSQTYYQCAVTGCKKYFSDSDMTQELTAEQVAAIKITKLGHDTPVHYDGIDGTCTATGIAETWYCTRCAKYYTNEGMTGTANAVRPVSPMHPHATEVVPEEITLTTNGNRTAAFTNNSNLKVYDCPDCYTGKYHCGTYNEFAVNAINYHSTYGYLVGVGESSVASNSTSTTITFQAPRKGVYTFVLSNARNAAASSAIDKASVSATGFKITTVKYWASETSPVNSYSSSRWGTGTSGAHNSKFTQNGNALVDTFTVDMEMGEIVVVTANAKYFDVEITRQTIEYPSLEGNTISITEADVWKDVYMFELPAAEPEEGADPDAIVVKTYKLTVPAGVSVGLVSADYEYPASVVNRVLIDGSASSDSYYTYVSVVAGQKIYLVFKSATTGEKPFTFVEDESEESGKLSLGVSLHRVDLIPRNQADDGTLSGGVMTFEIGAVPAGRYTVTLTLNQSMGRSTVYIGKNISETWTDYYTTGGNTKDESEAALRLSQMTLSVYDNDVIYAAQLKDYQLTFTLDLEAGDKLMFALGDATPCVLEGISLTPAAAE